MFARIQKIVYFSFFVLFLSSVGWSSIVLQLSEKEMVERSDDIVRGKVLRKTSQWDGNRRRIFTYTTLQVEDVVKGIPMQREIVIKQLGGQANGIGMNVPGSANFKIGEHVLVFLKKLKQEPAHHYIIGMSYGKLKVLQNAKQQWFVKRDTEGLVLAKRDANGKLRMIPHDDHKEDKEPVVLLKDYVKQLRMHLPERVVPSVPSAPSLLKKETPPVLLLPTKKAK